MQTVCDQLFDALVNKKDVDVQRLCATNNGAHLTKFVSIAWLQRLYVESERMLTNDSFRRMRKEIKVVNVSWLLLAQFTLCFQSALKRNSVDKELQLRDIGVWMAHLLDNKIRARYQGTFVSMAAVQHVCFEFCIYRQ